MKTVHSIFNGSSKSMIELKDNSIDLVVTSPPYPMVSMWDECFISQNEEIGKSFENKDYINAWLGMHKVLEEIWSEVVRVVKDGGFVCINIGDATRTFDENFRLFSNHSKVIEYFTSNGFYCLPDIIWRKRTNAPNKFMGSGMYPAGAYVTFEHENILVFRKGGKRTFTNEEKKIRQRSAYFYNERNEWFSDVWELMGTSQKGIKGSRERSGAYPVEIPYRLIQMYSIQGDTVLDPFGGLGTTMIASIMSCRNSVSYELDKTLCEYMCDRVSGVEKWNLRTYERLGTQSSQIEIEKEKGKDKFYINENLDIEVKTKQEKDIIFPIVDIVKADKNKLNIECFYKNMWEV